MYKLFLTLRYLRKRRIAYFAIGAVTLCVAMVLIVMSVMGGFLDQLKTKARGLLGDIIVDNRSMSGFPLYQEFIDDISRWPEIVKATPVLYSYGLIRFPNTEQTDTVRVVGIRLNEVYDVNGFRRSLFYEKYYPGTSSLAEQRQPLIGFDLTAPKLPLRDRDGGHLVDVPSPVLPPEFQAALEKTRAAGLIDDETDLGERDAELRAAGFPAFPGVYDMTADDEPPTLAGDPWPGLIIGRDIVAERSSDGRYRRHRFYPRGCVVTLTMLPVSLKGNVSDTPTKQAFRYVDDSRTGIWEIDSKHVYCDFELLQKLLQMEATPRAEEGAGMAPGRCSQIQIKLRPACDANAVARKLEDYYHKLLSDTRFTLDGYDQRLIAAVKVYTWEESQQHIIAPVEKERQLVTILFGIISLVAVVLVLCILYMIVLQKTRDIGIVKAIGGSSGGVAAIFIVYGAAVGIVGSVLGSILGVLFVRNINRIQEFLIWAFGWRVWDRSVYSFDEIPSTIREADVAVVIVFAIIAATFGSLAAAWRAGSMQPVEAIRYE